MRTWGIKTFMSYNALVAECRTIVAEERVIVVQAHDTRQMEAGRSRARRAAETLTDDFTVGLCQ